MNKNETIIIVGAGAAGLFCAWLLAANGRRAILLEAGDRPGRKLAISGGGHANFSNRLIDYNNYYSHGDPHFCQNALRNFGTGDVLALLGSWSMPWREKEHGRLFLAQPARNLVMKLQMECLKAGCEIIFGERVLGIERIGSLFHVRTKSGTWKSPYVALAQGSPARPRLAGCERCWHLAKSLGHTVFPPKSALAPIHYKTDSCTPFRALAGISLEAEVSLPDMVHCAKKPLWRDSILFTHSGLSGPAILNASLFMRDAARVHINFLPAHDFENLLDVNERKTPRAILRNYLPDRLADTLLAEEHGMKKTAELSRAARKNLAAQVNDFIFDNVEIAGLGSAEVCSGGVATEEINPATMESRIVPRLYIAGEMLDVTGELGGYNLHWAFAGAHAVAMHILRRY